MPKLTLSFKGQSIAVHHLEEGHTVIGRDADCDIVIDSLAVAPHHAEVTTQGDQCQVKGLDSSNPVLVNNTPTLEAVLKHGDLLLLGKHTLAFALDGYAVGIESDSVGKGESGSSVTGVGQEEERLGSGYLQILSGENIGRIIPLSRNMIRLGKAGRDCAIIVHRAGGYYLSYLEGAMPTVDGVPIGDESVLLAEGSTVRIGRAELQFYL